MKYLLMVFTIIATLAQNASYESPIESKFTLNDTVIIAPNTTTTVGNDLSFTTGFVEGLVMIFIAEFGDRSFMLIVLFTMKLQNKLKVFFPAILMMMTMHLVSVAFGAAFTMLFDRVYILIASVLLFLGFGTKLVYDACYFTESESQDIKKDINQNLLPKNNENPMALTTKDDEEHKEVENKINENLANKSKHSFYKHKPLTTEKSSIATLLTLLFIADWGDRCQITAVVLTATRNIWGVAFGGALGMGLCCALAAGCGVFLSGRISEKTTMFIGAALFYLFACESSWEAYKEWFGIL